MVTTLPTCPRLNRLVVNTWSGLDVVPSIPSTPISTLPQLTTLRIGSSGLYGRVPLRTFCLISQLMPALHTLSIGDIRNTSSDTIDDVLYPPCRLRSFVVSDARAIEFQSYDWLLHNSPNSLQILHTYGILSQAVASLLRALPHIGPSQGIPLPRMLGLAGYPLCIAALPQTGSSYLLQCPHYFR